MFLTHLLKIHNITKEQYLIDHPADEGFLMLANKTLNRQMEKDTSKYVSCAICGKKLARIDWRHLAKHGITKEEYKRLYDNTTVSKEHHNLILLAKIRYSKVNDTLILHHN